MTVTSPPGYTLLSADEAERRFRVGADIAYPYAEFADEQEIRLYSGGLRVADDLASEDDVDRIPYNTIVDGDLIVEGTLDWRDDGTGNFMLITGNLKAANLIMSGCPNLSVRGGVDVAGGILGSYGDDGGMLVVNGEIRSPLVIGMLYFGFEFLRQPEGLLIADPYRVDCPVDLTDDELGAAIEPELLDEDGMPEARFIEKALREGRPVLRLGVRPTRVVALEHLDELSRRAEAVTELDLSHRKLRELPEQLFRFPALRKLSLAGNDDIDSLGDRLGELSALEELDLSGMGLTELPEAIGELSRLRVLDIGGNDLERLPEGLARLARLSTLRAAWLTCPVPDLLASLTGLTELDLRYYRPGPDDRPTDFPTPVTELTGLRELSLNGVWLADVPEALLRLRSLERLDLSGALSAGLAGIPDLSRLPRLRSLGFGGNTPLTHQREPSRDLLAGVWSITTLEELSIDRWGEREDVRAPWTALPDDAFAALPRLRVLDASYNELTTLPDSFFALRNLESVDLRYTELDRPTLERIREVLPRVRMDLRHVEARRDPDDPNAKRVAELVQRGAGLDHAEAVPVLEQALALCGPGAVFSEYDRLYALYKLCDALANLVDAADGGSDLARELVVRAEQTLALIPDTIWHYTDFGAFQEEVKRRTGNALAWRLYRCGETERALAVVEDALTVASEPEFDFVRDTKVRILLALGRDDEAFGIVSRVLARDPDFADFADLAADPDYLAWRGNG